MADINKKKKRNITILIVIWIIIIAYNVPVLLNSGGKGKDGSVPVATGVRSRGSGLKDVKIPGVKLSLLVDKKSSKFDTRNIRNIFRPLQAPKPVVIKTPGPSPTPPPPPPPTDLEVFIKSTKFVGFFAAGGEGKSIFLETKGDVSIVKRGDLVGSKFRVVKLTDLEIVFKDVNTGEQASMALVK